MILPVIAYGDTILRKVAEEIPVPEKNTGLSSIHELIQNMHDTMQNAKGIGLAAPQVGKSVRLFIIDTSPLADEEKDKEYLRDFKKVFINPVIIEKKGEHLKYDEGCLSIPGIREDIVRSTQILIRYFDENFNLCKERYDGIKARIILHEYDHLDGIMFVDHLFPLKKRLLKRKLTDIAKGNIEVDYKMRFPLKKNKQAVI